MNKLHSRSHWTPVRCLGLLGLLVWLPAIPCWAHEDKHTHPALSVGAMLFLDMTRPEDGVLVPGSFRGLVRQGSIDEDQCPNYVNHFYDPKTGLNTTPLPPQVLSCDRPPGFVQKTAPARAQEFWVGAVSDYHAGAHTNAFLKLGHVFHLLQDMTSPAHVHNDVHVEASLRSDCQDGDDFENWGWSPDCTLGHSSFDNIYDYIEDRSGQQAWTLRPRLLTGLQTIFENQPQSSPLGGGGAGAGFNFVRELANKVYDFTTFQVTLRDTFNPNDPGGGELKAMFSSLEETTVPAAWWIGEVGYSQGECVYTEAPTFNESWWIMPGCSQSYESLGTVYRVEGKAYLENSGGGAGILFGIPETLIPSQYDRLWYTRRYGSKLNAAGTSMLRIYGDVMYPAAVAYGAGLLQAFLDEAIMPKPITTPVSQITPGGAQLNGSVDPNGEAAAAWFEWGADTSFGNSTPMQPVGAGLNPTNVNTAITGLNPDDQYFCRIVSSNRFGLRYGTNQTFHTPPFFTENAPNAWQITDNSTTSTLNYKTNLSGAHQQAATTNGWRYLINARFVSDFGGSKTMTWLYQASASKRFLIWWDLDANGNLTAEIEGQPAQIIATNGTGATQYHTHEIQYTNGTATYRVDGTIIGTWAGAALSLQPAGQVFWGSGSSAGMGQMNFHDVQFEIPGVGAVASYHAGTAGNPAVAPNPVTRGWTATPTAPAPPNAFTAVSPDFEPYVPLAETLPASDVLFESAQLHGRVDPRGYAALGWFEWGESPDYGNATSPVVLSSGFGWSDVNGTLNGIIPGQPYHYRFVVSNAFVVVYGADQSFVTGRPVVITSSEVPLPEWFRLRFVGVPGTAYEVQRSTNLTSWTVLGEGSVVSQGLFEFTDVAVPSVRAYYRVRSSSGP